MRVLAEECSHTEVKKSSFTHSATGRIEGCMREKENGGR